MNIQSSYFTNTIESKFISALMESIYLPSLPTIGKKSYLFEGNQYIYKKSLVKCSKDGYAYSDNKLNRNFEIIKPFSIEEYLPGLNLPYTQTENYYNPELHTRLFHYLQYLRDCEDIDLFPLFNCFNYKLVDNLSFDENNQLTRTTNNYKKLLLVPIEFNYSYAIAIQSPTGYKVKPIVYTNAGYNETLTNLLNTQGSKLQANGEVQSQNLYIVANSQYNSPNYITVTNTRKELEQYRNNIYLLIELDISNTSTVTVIQKDNISQLATKLNSITDKPNQIANLGKLETAISQLTPENLPILNYVNKIYGNIVFKYMSNEDSISPQEYSFDDINKVLSFTPAFSPRGNVADTFITFSYIELPPPVLPSNYIFNSDVSSLYHELAIGEKYEDYLHADELEKVTLPTDLSLLQTNDNEQHPFSDCLIEYLLANAISSITTISNNFKYAYDSVKAQNSAAYSHVNKYLWSDYLKYAIYTTYSNKHKNINIDNLGFLDRERESIIKNTRVKL